MTDFPDLMAAVAGRLLGEPNRGMSSKDELRFGTNGSLSVKVGGPHKGTWTDHEAGEGGGVLDLIARRQGGGREGALAWLKQTFPDFAGRPEAPSTGRRIVATYPSVDEAGALLFEVVRYDPKGFRQRRPDGAGGIAWDLHGVRQVPYHLPELIEAIGSERTVFIVEGEKDVDRLRALNVPATCNAAGAGKWRLDFVEHFVGADVVIVPDNDDPGRDHAEKVARALKPVATRVRVLTLPNLPRKGDVSDWLDAGGRVEELHRLAEVAPDWRPAAPATRLPAVWWGDEDKQPPLSWLVKGLLIEGGFSTVYGPPGTSKSFLVLDLALHVAHGRDWFGKRVAAGGVVYVSGEGGAGMLMRMKAWRQEKDGGAIAPFSYKLLQSVLGTDEDGDEITSCIIAPTDASTGEAKGTTRLPDTARIALDALTLALTEEGQPSPGGQVPNGVRVVTIERWREYAYRRGVSPSDEPAAKRQAFHRVRQKLQAGRLIGIWGDWVWMIL